MSPATLKRVSVSSGSTKKATFRIDEGLYEAMRDVVAEGAATSQRAFLEDAIRRGLKRIRKRELELAYMTAARDPAFNADMRATTEAFEATTADGLT